MRKSKPQALARREREIMDVLYKLERASVGQVLAALPDRLNYSTVRAQLRVLEEKGHVRHEEHGLRYIYFPAVPRDVARRSALRHLVETFFEARRFTMGQQVSSPVTRMFHRRGAAFAQRLRRHRD